MIKKRPCLICYDIFGIGSAISGVANAGVNVAGMIMQNKIAQENLQLQREKFDYDKQLQQQIFDREDTSYQRQRDDMLASGLNPLSNTASGASAGQAVQTEAPQNNMDALTAMSNIGSSINQIVDGIQNTREREATINKANEESAFIKSQKDSLDIENEFKRDLLEADRRKRTSDANEAERLDKLHEKYGTTSESPDMLKTATALLNVLDQKKLDGLIENLNSSGNKYLEDIGKSLQGANVQPSGYRLSDSDLPYIINGNSKVPKPKLSFKQRLWDSWSNSDNFFEQNRKKKSIEKNQRSYYESYIQALRNNSN